MENEETTFVELTQQMEEELSFGKEEGEEWVIQN